MRVTCGDGIFNYQFTANLLLSLRWKNFEKKIG